MPDSAKPYILAVLAAVLIGTGWTARGWYEDSKDLAAAAAIEKSRELNRELANAVSASTEAAIGNIKVENKTIYNEAQREVIHEKIYSDCVLPDSGRVRINQARSGSSAGKSDGQVRGTVPAP